jgi:hypothetical protein
MDSAMTDEMTDDQNIIRSELEQARERLSELENQLQATDAELAAMSARRQQFALVANVCESLEQLDEQGVAALFWGEQAPPEASGYIRQARRQVEKFNDEVAEVDARRMGILEQLGLRQDVVDELEEDLYQAAEAEERRKQEWLIERELGELPNRLQIMPWMRGSEDDWRFRKTLLGTAAVALLLALLIPLIEIPIPERSELIEIPERFAKLIREERPVPPAPPPPEPVPEERPIPEPEPLVAETTPQPTEPKPTPKPEPVVAQEAPKKDVQSAGILAFRESFSNLAEARPSARLGSDARISNAGDASIGRPERSMVTTQAPGSSGGINLASLSRDVGTGGGGGQIGGVALTRVASSIGAGGGTDRPLAGGGTSGRTDEEIQIVFDRYKAALYRLYNRELRRDPTLRGQMVLRLTIEPDGSVSICTVQASDLNAPLLSEQVVDRVRTFDFGAKDGIPAVTILYPIDFLPAA